MKDSFQLDESSDIPIYQQIVNSVERAILTGSLKKGDFLPSVRDFAVRNHVNPNTVSKAYQLLQGQGLAESVRGLGLKVSTLEESSSNKRKKELLLASIDALIETAWNLKVSKEDLFHAMEDRWKVIFKVIGGK